MKYHIITFGCQMNKADSERIAGFLESKGHKPALKENKTNLSAKALAKADLIVVNMCSVRQSAVDRVFGLAQKFKDLKIKKPKIKTVLTGCILKKDRQKLTEIFDSLLPQNFFSSQTGIKPKYQKNFQIFVPISNGCNNFCSYCVVPFVRGRLTGRDHKKILREINDALKQGKSSIRNRKFLNGASKVKEIWLLGQNVNDYSSPSSPAVNFSKLLKKINDIPGNFWIRFTSSHPKNFSDDLIEAMAECKKATPYLNLPVQSGDKQILKKMNRSYTAGQYKNLVKKIRKKIPEINLSTDVIVGFPGETKKQFQNTVKLFKEIKFDMAYISQYSPRMQTTAAKIKDTVPKKEKKQREKILTEILKKTALENNKKYIGKIVNVLALEEKNGFLTGKSEHYKTVKFKGQKNLIGKFLKVKIIKAGPWRLEGKQIKKAA